MLVEMASLSFVETIYPSFSLRSTVISLGTDLYLVDLPVFVHHRRQFGAMARQKPGPIFLFRDPVAHHQGETDEDLGHVNRDDHGDDLANGGIGQPEPMK